MAAGLTADAEYKEIGENYRFFLKWRQAAFAGYIVIFATVLTLAANTYYGDHGDPARLRAAAIFPLCAAAIGPLLWIIERRIRDLYHAAIRAGARLEESDAGFYSILRGYVQPQQTPSRPTQAFAVNALYWGGSAVLIASGLFMLHRW